MNIKQTLFVFVSGFIVYGAVTSIGAAQQSKGSVLATLANPVSVARADSGSRLKAKYLMGTDGSKDYQLGTVPWITPLNPYLGVKPTSVYYDTRRSEDCAFTFGADGVERCLPIDYAPYNETYLDAACTKRAIVIPAPPAGCSIAVPKYAIGGDSTPVVCPMETGWYPVHVYPVGALAGSNTPCYYKYNGTCGATQCGNQGSSWAAYNVGDEIAATSFVSSMATHDP